MNTLTSDGFCATRQPNGDVWIASRARKRIRTGQLAPEESKPIVIPKEQCEKLAMLLWPDLPLLKYDNTVPETNPEPVKVDYSRRDGEPE